MAASKACDHCSVPKCANKFIILTYEELYIILKISFISYRHAWEKQMDLCYSLEDEPFKRQNCSQHFKQSDDSESTCLKCREHGAIPSWFEWINCPKISPDSRCLSISKTEKPAIRCQRPYVCGWNPKWLIKCLLCNECSALLPL